MQLASYGNKALANARGHATHHLPKNHNPTQALRSIHIPAGPRPVPTQIHSTAQKVFTYSRTALGRFFVHLTAPSLIRAPAQAVNPSLLARRGIQTSARTTIKNGLTYPSRVALSRPFHLPKGPGPVASRSITQVGLGTARNFSSARPIFQNLVENVPVAGRALYEGVDFDMKRPMGKENSKTTVKKGKAASTHKGEIIKAKDVLKSFPPVSVQSQDEEMNHYFTPATPRPTSIVTSLLIPLAPTPTTRTPLSEYPPSMSGSSNSTHPSLLPRETLLSIHATHSLHAIRVSSLFHRLDTANVWTDGATCSAYAHGAIGASVHDDTSVCTVLKVDFVGWKAAEVRSVIGESGTGWCVLEEHNLLAVQEDDGEAWWDEELKSGSTTTRSSSRASSVLGDVDMDMDTSSEMGSLMEDEEEMISRSFVMPTLDFSSSFVSRTTPFVDPPSQNGYFSDFRGEARQGSGRTDEEWSSGGFSDEEWNSSSSSY